MLLKMEEIKINLELLLSSLPVTCTLINIQKLKLAFQEYKSLIASLPGKFSAIKKYCEKIFDFIKAKIELIEKNTISRKSKNIFQEAVDQLKSQIEMVLLTIRAEPA